MKRCPECRRDYYDDTLSFCLEDGTPLVYGVSADEPATAILSEPPASAGGHLGSDAATRAQIDTTAATAVYPTAGDGADKVRANGRRSLVTIGVSLLVVLVAGIGYLIYKYGGGQPAYISFESARITRLTNSGKVTNRTAISPDGKWLVYADQDGEQQSLWLKQVAIPDSNTQIVPPAPLSYKGLAFSPDGNYLYYTVFERAAATGTLYQVPVLGGTARKLFSGIWDRISFSPDGKQIAYFDYIDDEDRLMICNADGTQQRQLAVRKGNEFFVNGTQVASWSPDGKTIATTVGTTNPRNMSVATVSVATGEIDLFSSRKFDWTGGATWLADGKSMLLLASEYLGEAKKIWQISYPSGEAKKISNDLSEYEVISLTADSNALATVQAVRTSNIWAGAINDTARVTQVTSGSDINLSPSWAPDGKLVYTRNSGLAVDLNLVDPRGGSLKQLTSGSGVNSWAIASPDGKHIIFVSTRTGTDSIWRIDMDGSNAKQLTNAGDVHPSISPDGREIIFERQANKSTIWKVGIDGGDPIQLTENESVLPVFSPDGTQFACIYRDDPHSPSKLTIISSSGGTPIRSFLVGNVSGLRWMPDGRSIAFAINKGDVGNIWAQPIDGGIPKQITNFTSETIDSFDLSRDGKQIAISRGTQTSDVVLISGFKK